MRKKKNIKIDDREYTVFELTIEDLLSFKEIPKNPLELTRSMLPKICDITLDQAIKLTPSEIMQLWEAFKEVNSVLFEIEKKTGFFAMVKTEMVKTFGEVFAGLSEKATQTPPNTE